jgi:hypothetical protein
VLDNIQRWRLLVQPPGENALELIFGYLALDLDEGARELLVFPGRRHFAGAQADDDVLDTQRLAGPERQVANDAVALV